MPLYEYTCRACGTTFERRLKFEERLLPQTCPACGGAHTLLRISAPAHVGAATGAAADAGASGKAGGGCCGGACGCGRGWDA